MPHFSLKISPSLAPFFSLLEKLPYFSRRSREKAKTRQASILKYWQAIEYFSPQSIDKPDRIIPPPPDQTGKIPPGNYVFVYGARNRLPWEQGHWIAAIQAKPNTFLRFQIYGGVYPIKKVYDTLANYFGKGREGSEDPPITGDTCVYSVHVTKEGRPLMDTFALSTCAWALGRVRLPSFQDPACLNGFDEKEEEIKQLFLQEFGVKEDDMAGQALKQENFQVGRTIQPNDLRNFTEKVSEVLNIASFIPTEENRIKSSWMSYKADNDLARKKTEYQVAETDFLNSFFLEDLEKIAKNIMTNKDSPSKKSALAQLLSPEEEILLKNRIDLRQNTDHILERLAPCEFPSGCWPTKGHHPLVTGQQFAVNAILSELSRENGMLAVNGPPGTGKTTLLRDLVSGIVVERAKRLATLKAPQDAFVGKEDSWSVNDYQRPIYFWKEEFKGFDIVVASSNNGAVENVVQEMPVQEAIDPSWEEEMPTHYFENFAQAILNKPAWALIAPRLGKKQYRNEFAANFWFGNKNQRQKKLPGEFPPLEDQDNSRNCSYPPDASKGFKNYLQFFEKRESSIDWRSAVQQFNAAAAREKKLRKEAQAIYELFCQAAAFQAKAKKDSQRRWVKIWPLSLFFNSQKAEVLLKGELDRLQAKLSKKIADVSLADWLNSEEQRELLIPWLTPEWFKARVQVFLEALNLHKAFILATPKIMRRNLQGAIDILQGNVGLDADPAAIASAWTTLSFVIPVISTTFASFSRLFSLIGQEGIGWLLIDEAGQATPQAAAGGIWRSKRCVVVGDPMQLRPIVNLPVSAQTALQKIFATENTWIPGVNSLQELADRICYEGTYIKRSNAIKWVGMPLRVHRRCERPEFILSNTISYGGLMIFGTPERPFQPLPKSRWIHIDSMEASIHGHWIPEEGNSAKLLVAKLVEQRMDPKSIFVISPFRSVVSKLTEELGDIFKSINIGTIHTTQGKEADVVIMVLGGNPQSPGAKKWASEEPNLLHVAVSRAKQRFYIIGNEREWSQYPYFRDASELLHANQI